MSGPEKLRLFVAIDLPGPLLTKIAQGTTELRSRRPQARWAPVESQHITLKFLGAVVADRLENLTSPLAEVASRHEPARMALGPLGAFPSPRRAKVLWVGVEDPPQLLAALAGDLASSLQPLGFEPEKRRFTAHLTLARFREPTPLGGEPLLGQRPVEGEFDVDRFVLYRSHLSPKGARYEALAAFPLAPDRGGADS